MPPLKNDSRGRGIVWSFSGSAKLAAISRENLKKIFIMPDDINDDDNGMPKENDLEQ